MSSKFFRFPIALLAYKPDDPFKTLNGIVDYCCAVVGEKLCEGDTRKEILERLSDMFPDRSFGSLAHNELIVTVGAKHLNVRPGSTETMFKEANKTMGYLNGSLRPSTRNMATLSTEWTWACFHQLEGKNEDERPIAWREYRILAALLSKVGASKSQKCGWQEIQARAAGWSGKLEMRSASPAEHLRRAPLMLTRQQIRTTLTRLEADKFFARYNHGWNGKPRESYFSFSMSREELAATVLNRKTRKRAQVAANREADFAMVAMHKPTGNQH